MSVTGTVNDMRVLMSVTKSGSPIAVEEWYDTRDADHDTDIDTLTGMVSDVAVGRFVLSELGPLSVSVVQIIVGGVTYTGSSVAYEEEITPEPITTADGTPTEFGVTGFYPNPFNPVTQIGYSVPEDCRVTLTVYDITGRRVAVLVDEYAQVGTYSVVWDASDESGARLSSGLYLYNLTAGSFRAQGKVLLLK